MRILVTGSNGQVGYDLLKTLAPLGEVIGISRERADLSDPKAVSHVLGKHRPDCIVNAAAYTGVDKAEFEPDAARALNAELPEHLAVWSREQGACLIHYSTDYVYSGEGSEPWIEDAIPKPRSVYGQTKLEGDWAVLNTLPSAMIFRTSWVYSSRGNNFMKTMLRLGAENDQLRVVADQIGAPTPSWLIAQITAMALYRKKLAVPLSGLYHLTSGGETSWHGFAQEIFRLGHKQGMDLQIKPESVEAITTGEYPTTASRPLNSRLSLNRIERDLQIRMPDWKYGLALTLSDAISFRPDVRESTI